MEGGESTHWAIDVSYSNAYFNSCTFRGLSREQEPENPEEWEPLYGALHVSGLNATLAFENCTLTAIANPLPLDVGFGGLVYSDDPAYVVRLHSPQWHIPSSAGSRGYLLLHQE